MFSLSLNYTYISGMEQTMTLFFNGRQNLTAQISNAILQTLLEFETSEHGTNKMERYECIKQNIQDVEIVQWILQYLSKGRFGRFKINENQKSNQNQNQNQNQSLAGIITKSKMFFSFSFCLFKIGFYLLDIYKDFVTLQVNHWSFFN